MTARDGFAIPPRRGYLSRRLGVDCGEFRPVGGGAGVSLVRRIV